ncbi:dnaJ homolog subfamily C member 1 [Tribolium castaneum]|uniref:Uncharacterized protein F54F2.9-like Protein n=1 Tax=Tribolium castaneum TaxID=7070 RepID=D6WT93_TRICA|nr:PREDICTED: dnaJ homolog subfamily C member 1 [Tribolium castaneum]EFA07692.1 Uncharacterized protein F54F2.9-like Protein [Tribolium castaneum]|eukprot:XP_974769.2 PREDICTED: dnaJ homolog subfamily C member 1 [Tribolium castaneum]
MIILRAVLFIFCLKSAAAWDSEQLEVFDVVDEVKENFYTLLNVSQTATNQEIKSAFRALSLKLHPDKNPHVDTSVQFRNLVAVYEVLRSSTKRQYYDEVLVNGLPNWRSAVYYYRYVRKMGMVEVCIILFVIVTIGQYLVNWASYFERKYTIEQNKKVKRGKKSDKTQEPAVILEKPSITDTLPVQIPRLLWFIIISLPKALGLIKTAVVQQIEEVRKPPPPEEPEEAPVRIKTVRKRNKGFVLPDKPNFETTFHNSTTESNASSPPPVSSGGLWTDDDLAELVKLVKKYPGGTSGRWETIAEIMGRSVPEVTYMANKMKENCYKLSNEQEEEPIQVKVKQKTKKEVDGGDDVKKWSQSQQKALEEALAKYPKGCAERWDKIADCVPNKTKEECMMRFRYLAETVKKQKESTEQQPPD